MNILWLASWYPNLKEPVNGDFIQRQAMAVAEILPITVIHVMQCGPVFQEEINITRQSKKTKEMIKAFAFKPIGIALIDKLRYNFKYYSFYKKEIKKYINEYGKPAIIHVHIPIKAGLVAKYFATQLNVPYIVSEHSSHYTKHSYDSFFKRSKYFRHNTAKVFAGASCVINVSNAVAQKMNELFQIKRHQTIRNTVDVNLFYYKEVSNKIFRWIHVSSLNEHQKNINGIIKAFIELNKQQTNWELVMVGPFTTQQMQICAEHNLNNKIIFIGEVEYSEVAKQLQQANAFVLFSRHENFPCVIEEALCCGLPVVASNVGGIAEAVNVTNGLLVANENIIALTDALNNVINNYSYYNRKQISVSARALYNKEKIAQEIIDVYKSIIE
ncbi:MAG: glycosyltransferase [Bacteroidetes bacterium]|nr:glycosyltransferase [Bacteroidota bacterium]MBS1649619.1 glycosyltransferase [Bacteroidota bacterium]